jgi:hypothetical protein
MNEDEVRELIGQVITERTMPKVWGAPDPEWLIPFRVYSRDYNDGLNRWIERVSELEKEVRQLKARIGEHIP